MSGRGHRTTSSSKSKSKTKQSTRSLRAGLTFPVSRVVRFYIMKEMLEHLISLSIDILSTALTVNVLVKVHQYT